MGQLRDLAVKSIAALREAQAAGVTQARGFLGGADGCRCAEGVIGDMLVGEGILGRSPHQEGETLFWWNLDEPTWESPGSLSALLPDELEDLAFVPIPDSDYPNLKRGISTMNDRQQLTFGQIADEMEKALEEGFYGE